MALTEKEREMLEELDNPEVVFTGISLVGSLFSSRGGLNARKRKVVKLRMKMRAEELGIDPKKDWQKMIQLENEEEARFDKRFDKGPSKQ